MRSAYATFEMRLDSGVCELLLLTEFIIFLGGIGAEKHVDRQSSKNRKILSRSEGTRETSVSVTLL